MGLLKEHYIETVLNKYKIDRGMYESPDFREEMEETFSEKKEWEEYESHLFHLVNFIPHILLTYLSHSSHAM